MQAVAEHRRGVHVFGVSLGPLKLRRLFRRLFRHPKAGLAFVMRRLTPLAEWAVPPLGRRMRRVGWIWQPAVSHRALARFYARRVDPFRFDGTPYERGKYEHTLRLRAGRRYRRTLEIGAAEGIFSELLAPICDELVTVEVADAAVVRARLRLAGHSNVTILRAALPMDMPEGDFDLIVASDVLYYFPKDVLESVLDQLEAALAPGGLLLALHFRGKFGAAILGGDVHDMLRSRTRLEVASGETVTDVGPNGAGYIVTVLRRADAPR